MAAVVVALDGGFPDRAVHPFDLAVGPGVVHLDQAVPDAVLGAGDPEGVAEGIIVLLAIGELNAVVGEDGVDAVGQRTGDLAQERGASILPAVSTSLAKATLLVRSMPTDIRSLPSSVRSSAMLMCRWRIG